MEIKAGWRVFVADALITNTMVFRTKKDTAADTKKDKRDLITQTILIIRHRDIFCDWCLRLCPQSAPRGQQQLRSNVPDAWQRLKCALLCIMSPERWGDTEPGQGSKGRIALSPSADRITRVWTRWHIGMQWKAALTHLKPRGEVIYLSMSGH